LTSPAVSSDAATLDAILHTFYEVISGAAGQARDWTRFRSLFAPGARLMPVVSTGDASHLRLLSPDDFIRRVEPIFASEDFWEQESGRATEVIGRMAHVLSSYESRRNPQGAPFEHGRNSIQLFFDGARWWIVNVMWNTPRSE
jgi:hypothetical protein